MLKIWGKLFIGFILITLVTVSSVGWLLNYSFQERFAEYVKSNVDEKHENVLLYIESQLNDQVTPHEFFLNLAHFSVMENVRVQMILQTGEVIFDSRDAEWMAPFRRRRGGLSGTQPYETERILRSGTTEVLIRVSTELSNGFWSPNDITFREAIYYSLLAAVGVALFLAVAFSIFLSSMITSPIARLKRAALQISRGDWKARVKIRSGDELEELGESFNKMALDLEHLESLRRKMTTDMAHELRNPLMSIQAYIEGMIDGVIDSDETHLNELHEEVQRLNRLISDLNKLAQVEARRQVQPTQVHLYNEYTPYFERFKLLYEQKAITFTWEIDHVEGSLDKYIVKEILQNLLDNALKYTLEGGKVYCRIKRVWYEEKPGLSILVEDSGIGIGPEDVPFIFERFYRADPSRARQTGGTGIGLAITKELVELVDGKVSVTSELGVGTTFNVYIPFMK